jgi:hypothetical protein
MEISTRTKIIIAAALLCMPLSAFAAERELIYTYVGPVAGAGMNRITYQDWFYYTNKKNIKGMYLNGGVSLWVISKWLIGDFSIQYMYNRNERDLQHLFYTLSGRLGVRLGTVAIFTPGVGLYFESPPSNRKYLGGAGLRAPIGFLFNTTYDTKLFLEGAVMYGWYGMGEKSVKLSYGINLGFIFKVGNM